MIYANFDNQGSLLGFYDSEINENIPETAKEISAEVHQAFLNNQGTVKINPETLQVEELPPLPQEELIAQARIQKLTQNNANCTTRFSQGIIWNNSKFDMDDTAKANILLILWNTRDTDTIPCLDYDSNIVNLAKQELQALSGAIIQATKNIYIQQKTNAEAISVAQTIEDINAVNIDYTDI